MLLWAGIGDTIRISLSADPVEEVKVGVALLKSLGLRHRGVTVIACPSCARQQFDVINTVKLLEQKLAHITAPITISVIGCVVNGPGKPARPTLALLVGAKVPIRFTFPGQTAHRLKDPNIVDHLVQLVEEKARDMENGPVANG